ncbi:hypothetical protein L914_03526, partial [Phytophthora nicotianae]
TSDTHTKRKCVASNSARVRDRRPIVVSGYGSHRTPRSTEGAQLQGDELWEVSPTGATARDSFYERLY